MHGIMLEYLMAVPTKKITASLADKRPIDLIALSNQYIGFGGWTKHNSLSVQEKMKLALYKRYDNIRHKRDKRL